MHPLAEQYFSLNQESQKLVQIFLCKRAYEKWLSYVEGKRIERYRENVCGTVQIIDRKLPQDAIEAVLNDKDQFDVAGRYREPIAAMQDDDLEFPDGIELAYYSIYNLFRFHIEHKVEDSWVIVNQALSALGENEALLNLEAAIKSLA